MTTWADCSSLNMYLGHLDFQKPNFRCIPFGFKMVRVSIITTVSGPRWLASLTSFLLRPHTAQALRDCRSIWNRSCGSWSRSRISTPSMVCFNLTTPAEALTIQPKLSQVWFLEVCQAPSSPITLFAMVLRIIRLVFLSVFFSFAIGGGRSFSQSENLRSSFCLVLFLFCASLPTVGHPDHLLFWMDVSHSSGHLRNRSCYDMII